MTWQDDQRVLCDALMERGYRVEMSPGGLCQWSASWTGEVPHVWWGYVWPVLGVTIGAASTIPEAVALVVKHLDLDGRPLPPADKLRSLGLHLDDLRSLDADEAFAMVAAYIEPTAEPHPPPTAPRR